MAIMILPTEAFLVEILLFILMYNYSSTVSANHFSKLLPPSVYKRPHCEEFMKFCLEKFEVGIWSSARE
jgi:hypothetical protein